MDIKEKQREHYDRFFREYEDKSERSAYMNLMRSKYTFKRWGDRLAHKRVLDLGCGHGHTAFRLAAVESLVIGVDISAQFVHRARERIFTYARAGWIQSDAEKLPLVSETFDAVVSLGTLHHLPHPELAILEISRLLKPGGWLLALEPNGDTYLNSLDFYKALIPPGLYYRLRQWQVKRPVSRSEVEKDELHVGVCTPAQYCHFFNQAGMKVNISTLILPIFPLTFLGLHRYVAIWQIVVWISKVLAVLLPFLRKRGQVQIIEAQRIEFG
ncbi:MAG: class I SAM-dependent methyltransferase [Anaerolineae bacterium]|nr:class I SAM-dependent methyltransferase [Anaerolineae bacterium]